MKKEKLLEFIQDAINRFSSQSFIIKGWTITVLTALMVFLKESPELKYNLLFGFLIFSFCGLDSYYLQQERKYRIHFNNILNDKTNKIDMDIFYLSKKVNYFSCYFSKTMILFYGSLVLFILIINLVQ